MSEVHFLNHKHLILQGFLRDPIRNVEYLERWKKNLISKIGMEIFMGPFTKYSELPGNTGITSATVITTSHIVIHTFEEGDKTEIQFDCYSCADYCIDDVIEALTELGLYNYRYRMFDRNYEIVDIERNV